LAWKLENVETLWLPQTLGPHKTDDAKVQAKLWWQPSNGDEMFFTGHVSFGEGFIRRKGCYVMVGCAS